jgi:dipeptidyl aminopeptidase/acylaminoacyl peptidase
VGCETPVYKLFNWGANIVENSLLKRLPLNNLANQVSSLSNTFSIFTKKQTMRSLLFSAFIFIHLLDWAQNAPNHSTLSLGEIMKGNEFIGHQPENIRWSIDGTKIYFDWNPKNEPGNSTYELTVLQKEKKAVLADKKKILEFDPSQANFSDQYLIIDGAFVHYSKKTKALKLIYHSDSPIQQIIRSNSPNIVFFQQDANLFSYNNLSGSIQQISNFKKGERDQNKIDSTYLEKQQVELFEFIRDKNERKAWNEKQEIHLYELPSEFYYGKKTLENLQVNPQGKFIAFRLSEYPPEKETRVENYMGSDGYSKTINARAKVGIEEPSHQLALSDIEKDSVYFVDFSKLSDIRKKPAYLNDTSTYEKDREIIMHSLKFTKNASQALCDIRSYDNKDRWIVLIDLGTGKFKEIDHQHDDAWIGGPGISSWNEEEGTLGWLKDDKTAYFQSEVSGYSHLYLYSISTNKKEQLTDGKWEVHQVMLSQDGSKFYITGNRSHPGNRDFLSYDISAHKLIPILTQDGYHDVLLSPDEKTLAMRFSDKNEPWELYLAPNIQNTKKIRITDSRTPNFKSYNWTEPKVITFKGSDNTDVYARLYEPTIDKKNSAAIIFVHGAGYLQNAHNYWSNYYREYMFHHLLMDNGFTVLDIDYRASEGYGRDYRTAIFRHMGGRDLQDHLDGKNYLVNKLGIDSNRVGIYGGSYGGFITLMAMLSTPGKFNCGAALRSVTDWAHYNHEYTSNILNYPDTDPEAYKRSSPIYFAKNLQGKLLMLHGMVDDNVQFQDVVRLSQRFIELGKENWELAVFPVESHGFKESYSWNDEYRRIYELFYSELILKFAK